MATKVYRQGNYLIISDVATSDIIWSKYAVNVVIEPDKITPSIFRFYDVLDYRETGQRSEFFHSDISLLQELDSTPYTKSSFILFYTDNTGTVYVASSGFVETVTGVGVDNTDPFNPIITPSGGVTSVNGQTGVVVLDADDIDDSSTVNKFSSNFNVDLDSSEASVVRVFAGGRTTYTITHALNSLDVTAQTFRLSNGRTVGLRVERTGVNTIDVSRSGNSADGIYRVLIGKIG